MKSVYIRIMLAAGLLITAAGCNKKEDLDISNLFPENTPAPTAIDNWITANYTKPYNIEVKYRWQPFEAPTDKTLVPIQEEKVVPIMDIVSKTWIAPYIKIAGLPFFLKYTPKQFILIGSPKYNSNGTIGLGEAEGGKSIQLLQLNLYHAKNEAFIKQMLHTIHHEFAHILHQNILYPREFKNITPGSYTSNWNLTSQADALAMGFITPYSRASFDEDFVEIASTMLTEGKAGFEKIVNSTPNTTGQQLIRQKAQIVRSYFINTWKIDFDKLQSTTVTAIAEVIK
ncbi:zinc-binding metallopeptidase [Chitinophaga nivalis]|uniref:Zinc-binding metallopeptidase n=1 Tax=Chitinophaga nivalis TaxID=2991709 RepID=A0ABT3IEL8_9BACT|nr:putative zinc-binding metallopeptidase [Chitinophaga nivalis]MCW3467902.1 putative zinc-binding metallopeptidase [Chitinophaga nivalis]MCW3482407.1 putative zinc-binding metallopeptidase [Chitinophaga nivalis]